ncbi:MAG: DNA gyrase subunit A [Lautropia sp.]
MDQFAKETLPVSLEQEMRRSFLDYAMSVIVGRALPDVRDGLKPVHRRVLYAMHELGNDWNRAYKKSARIVGDVIGKYHPHGDTAVYDTIVRMAQPFSLRYMLVDGQGNFGSVDGDSPAAMRYTEVRLSKIAHEMLQDIDKETVDFGPNYDGSESEPLVLPARFPNLLVNGSTGIAVAMATNIPPHNMAEVIEACQMLLADPQVGVDQLIEKIPAPDFPTGGIIYGVGGVREGYRTGRGRVVIRAVTHVEEIDGGRRQAIVVDELPYQVNKVVLQQRIAELVNEKKIEGISDIRDESDKDGMRLVVELKRGENAEVILNNLYKQTQLQDSFGINMVALLDGQPRLLNLKQMLEAFLSHRREVVTRRTVFELRKARERGHLLEGLAVAVANVDEMVALIRASPTPPIAKERLLGRTWNAGVAAAMLERAQGRFDLYRPDGVEPGAGLLEGGQYQLSSVQATEILQMRLQRLTGLELDKIVDEYREIVEKIADLIDILEKPARISAIISAELDEVAAEFGDRQKDPRRSRIEMNAFEIDTEDLIAPQDMVVTLSHAGYIKSQPLSEYRSQGRGGRGKSATTMREDDWIDRLFVANTHDVILCFTNRGRVYSLKVWEVPVGSRTSKGKPVVNIFPLEENEKINVVLPIKDFDDAHAICMATSQAVVKRTRLAEFANVRKNGIIAVDLDEGDYLIGAAVTDGSHDVMLFSDSGKAVRFAEGDVRMVGRGARGVRGMTLEAGRMVVAMLVSDSDSRSVLIATENGFGKRTPVSEYTRHRRGSMGLIAIQASERNGPMVGAVLVDPTDELMLVTNAGVVVRTPVAQIREIGRATQGVRLMNVDEGDSVSGLQCIAEPDGVAAEVDADGAPGLDAARGSAGDEPDGPAGAEPGAGDDPSDGPSQG